MVFGITICVRDIFVMMMAKEAAGRCGNLAWFWRLYGVLDYEMEFGVIIFSGCVFMKTVSK